MSGIFGRNSSTGQPDQIASTGESLHTLNQAADGYDPSTGRTPVEQSNNGAYVTLVNATYTAQVKAAPGFIKGITISTHGTVTATHLAIYDSLTASGTILDLIRLPAATETVWIDEDTLATTGIYIATATVTAATGVVANAATGASGSVTCSIAYR